MPVIDVDATVWFDTLKPVDPPSFDTDHPGWCRRHWAPAIRLQGNGTAATLQLASVVFGLIRGHVPAGVHVTFEQFRARLGELGPACCIAGDKVMYDIWARWLPET